MKYSSKALMSTTFLALALLCGTSEFAYANPMDGVVTSGQATISLSGKKLDITQQSNRAVIDWRGFDIAPDEHTQFYQPDSKSIAINRVNSTSASKIDGKLTANGNVVIINQNGVLFGQNAKVDVNGLIATTADIDNAKAMTGSKLVFDKKGNPQGAIINKGQITAKEAGLVGFVAPNVINDGIITANLGRVHLASGDTATIDLYGDGLMSVAVSDDVKSQLVSNTGAIDASGGKIALTAAAGKTIVNSLINVQGSLKAQSVQSKNGDIIISAAGSNSVENNIAANKGKKSGSSNVVVQGVIDASGRDKGEKGGKVTVTGDHVAFLAGTVIDASGYEGKSGTTTGKEKSAYREGSAGGDIRIGGDYLGQGDTPTAKTLYVDEGALVLNDALYSGDAGRTIFWSDDTTQFYGNVYARALGGKGIDQTTWNATTGGNKGDGGFVETSGHGQLDAGGYVDLTSSGGARGTYFLDPTNITIYGNFNPAYTSTDGTSVNLASSLVMWLDAADRGVVELTYSNSQLNSATATGLLGQNVITTSTDISDKLAVGARIRLGSSGAITTASTQGADTYVITGINGNTITLGSALTSNYNGSDVYRGLASGIADKSSYANNAIQTWDYGMPLWVSNGINGQGTLKLDGQYNYMSVLNDPSLNFGTGGFSTFTSIYVPSTSVSIYNEYGILNKNGFYQGTPGWGTEFSTYPGPGGDYGYVSYITSANNWGEGGADFSSPLSTDNASLSGMVRNGTTNTLYINGSSNAYSNAPIADDVDNGNDLIIGKHNWGPAFNGYFSEAILYNAALDTTSYNLINQYQSAKWNGTLTPPGSGSTEAQKAMASTARGDAVDGYSAFTTGYLERLSASADISLQASNDIILDFQNSRLELAANRSITLTAGRDITAVSGGGILLGGTGDVMIDAGRNISFHGFSSAGDGDITYKAGNDIYIRSFLSTSSGNIVLNADSDGDHKGAVMLGTGSALATNGGNITVGGGADPTTGYAYGSDAYENGIKLQSSYISATGTVTLNGHGSTTVGAGGRNGIHLADSTVQTVAGDIFLNGIGGNGNTTPFWGDIGVYVSNGGGVQSQTGDITINGTGGTAEYSAGVMLDNGYVKSTGMGATAGNIDITGVGTSATAGNFGFGMNAGYLQSIDGDITVTGTTNNYAGIGFGDPAYILTTGDANVSLTGITTGTGKDGIISGQLGGSQATGNYTFNLNSIDHYANVPLSVTTAGTVSFTPRTASTTIGLYNGAGSLSLSNLILDHINAGNLVIGRTDGTGLMTAGTGNWSAGNYTVNLQNGAGIRFGGNFNLGNHRLVAKTGAAADIEIASGGKISSSAGGNAIVLASGRNFSNLSNASNALTATGGGRWLVYSTDPVNDSIGNITPGFRNYNCVYGGACPALGTGNGLLYASTTVPVSPQVIMPTTVVMASQGPAINLSQSLRDMNNYQTASDDGKAEAEQSTDDDQYDQASYRKSGEETKKAGGMLTIDPALAKYLGI